MYHIFQPGTEQDAKPFVFTYVNHAGIEGVRNVLVLRSFFGTSKYYTEPQWLIECWDLDKNALRHYALSKLNLGKESHGKSQNPE